MVRRRGRRAPCAGCSAISLEEFAAVKHEEFDDGLVEITWNLKARSKGAGVAINLAEIQTVADCIRVMAALRLHAQRSSS